MGDTLDVYVISFDPEKHKISLGVKDRSMNPWDKFMATYHVGDVANVRIVKLMTFGAFAEVVPGVDGLIHISQIADRRLRQARRPRRGQGRRRSRPEVRCGKNLISLSL